MRKLPKTIYVYEEKDGDEFYLNANYNRQETAEKDAPRYVGTYRLIETGMVQLKQVYDKKTG